MDKSAWRRELIRRRLAVPADERRGAARAMACNMLGLPEAKAAATVALYAAVRGEAPTARLALLLCLAGKSVALPVSEKEGRRLVFRRVRHWRQLRHGAYGILEPVEDCPLVPPGDIDLMVVPGVGFDRLGLRLGYGAGYYDRYLSGLPAGGVVAGLAFACQVVPLLPHEPHDRRVDLIVMEKGVIRTGDGDRAV